MSDIRVAFVMATWHDDLVDRTKLGFFERMAELGHSEDAIDVHKLPGALEFPLHCKKLAQTGNYDVIVTAVCDRCTSIGQRDLFDRFSRTEYFSCDDCGHMWQRRQA